MADGQPRSYSHNAQIMAAGAPGCSLGGCPSCVKAGLPVLLVRPGLGEKQYADGIKDGIAPLLKGTAEPKLSYSGYVMRTLRRGYVYAYYEKPHTPEIIANDGWQVFSVDEGGYLTPHSLDTLPLVGSAEQPTFSCQRTAGYASAMLFVIPDAKNTGRVWVAYSEHPWSETVRGDYAGDDKVEMRNARMTCINAPDADCDCAVPLTAANMQRMVADYSPLLPDDVLKGNPHPRLLPKDGFGSAGDPFPFLLSNQSQPGRRGEAARHVVDEAEITLKRGRDQFALEDAKIVAVCDAVGATTEAAQLRMTLCSTAAEWALEQAGRDEGKAHWKLMSALSVDGLLEIIEQRGKAKKLEYSEKNYARYNGKQMYHREFSALQQSGELPPDAEFSATWTRDPGGGRGPDYTKPGYVSVPDNDAIDHETSGFRKDVLDKLEKEGDSLAYRNFLDTYRRKADEDKARLANVEKDYFSWLDSPARKQVTSCDFDEEFVVDGMFYCDCVSKLTFAGPLTDNGLEWYKNFLTDDPDDKENLLLRALLGNQKSAFKEWIDKKKGPYGQLKSIVSQLEKALNAQHASTAGLSEANKKLLRWLPYFKISLAGMASPVLAVAGAVATGLRKRNQIGAAFQKRLKALSGVIAGQSSAKRGLALLKVQLPLHEAARFWRRQIGALQNSMKTFSGKVRGEQVQSLVLDGAIALEARGAVEAGDALIDVYIWVSDVPEAIGDALEEVKDLPTRTAAGVNAGAAVVARGAGRYVLRPAAANLNRAWQGAARVVTRSRLDQLARNSVVLASNGSALLATGSGVFSTLALLDAWEKFEHGSVEERQKAAVSLLTSALGVSSAFMSLGAEMAKQASREAMEQGLKRTAGIVGAVATVIDSVQTFIGAFEEAKKGDTDAAAGMVIQSVLLAGAAVAGGVAAFTGGTAAFLGLSVTGWGLILVALGIIAGFIVAALQDSPTEEWVTRSIWGGGSKKWGSHQREQEELNKLLMGVRVDFSYRNRFTNMGNYSRSALHQLNPLERFRDIGKIFRGERPGPQVMREAWARIMMPEELLESVPFMIRFVAKRNDGKEARVAYYARRPDNSAFAVMRRSVQRENDTEIVNPESNEETKGGIWTLELSAQLDVAVYEDAWAEVLIYADSEAEEAPVVEQILQDD